MLMSSSPHMRDEVLLAGERLRADLAGVGRVSRVLLEMVGQMLFPRESLVTEFASMWGLASVYSKE